MAQEGPFPDEAAQLFMLSSIDSDRYCIPDETTRLQPLLSASVPSPIGGDASEYSIDICRSSRYQQFGIGFKVMKRLNGGTVITVDEHASHLGLHRGDVLLKING